MTYVQNLTRQRRVATRKDLLVVQQDKANQGKVLQDTPAVPSDPEAALLGMGFRVERRHQNHWVVTGRQPLPELHFYSNTELGRFVMDRATRYLTPCPRSIQYADTAHLSG